VLIYCQTRPDKKRKSPTKKEAEAYNQWLQSLPKSLSGKPTTTKKSQSMTQAKPYRRETPSIPSKQDTVLGACTNTGIMKNFHKMSKEDRDIVQKVSECVAPMHKGNLVYVTPGINPAGLGRKNEVL
jgi:hypothetical protein